jgi:hypothetical protein
MIGVGSHSIIFFLERAEFLFEAADIELSLLVFLLQLLDFREQLISLALDLSHTLARLGLMFF